MTDPRPSAASEANTESDRATVALFHGPDRAANLAHAFEAVAGALDWAAKKSVLVKPNLVVPNRPLAATHPESLETVLGAIRQRYSGPLIVAEGSALSVTGEAFARYGYAGICQRYDAEIRDLNADDAISQTVRSARGAPLMVRMARTVIESDCRISLAIPKTHDTILVTLGIKNMIMGGLVNRRLAGSTGWADRIGRLRHGHGNGWGSDKIAMHQGYPTINLNLALLAPLVLPHLTLLDGFRAMEGEGPIDGTEVPWRLAIAGTDALATDLFTADIMGYGRPQVGYLEHCAALGIGRTSCVVQGNVTPDEVRREFRPHPRHRAQRRWVHAGTADVLAAARASQSVAQVPTGREPSLG